MPFKGLADPKRRLAPVLRLDERRALADAMLADVLAALRASHGLSRIVLVSPDPAVLAGASCRGAEPLPDGESPGYRAAAEQVAQTARAAGADGLLVLPADLPLLTPADVERLLRDSAPAAVTIVADRHGDGTNALLSRPPGAIPYRFGSGSFAAHRHSAERRGLSTLVLDLPNLALDIDRPEDLRYFLAELHTRHSSTTGEYLTRISPLERLDAITRPAE